MAVYYERRPDDLSGLRVNDMPVGGYFGAVTKGFARSFFSVAGLSVVM